MNSGHIGIIGFGAIARDLVQILSNLPDGAPSHISILVKGGREDDVRAQVDPGVTTVTADFEAFITGAPEVVAECAGHGAVAALGPAILSEGIDLVVASVGALADEALMTRLGSAAKLSGAQCVVPAGAIGGIDALAAARISGLKSVTYSGRKPPGAWVGTPAEELVDLAALSEPFVFFEGPARQAALEFPKNANVAATLALVGMGMRDTKVRLIADPTVAENVHEFKVSSEALDFSMRLVGKPSPQNPKTSRSTVYSIARAVMNRSAAIVI